MSIQHLTYDELAVVRDLVEEEYIEGAHHSVNMGLLLEKLDGVIDAIDKLEEMTSS